MGTGGYTRSFAFTIFSKPAYTLGSKGSVWTTSFFLPIFCLRATAGMEFRKNKACPRRARHLRGPHSRCVLSWLRTLSGGRSCFNSHAEQRQDLPLHNSRYRRPICCSGNPFPLPHTHCAHAHVHKVDFSREALGKASGLPPARAFYALEVMLCSVGKEAGLGTTLLVDCGVGVLAARGRVLKFTFVQVCCHIPHSDHYFFGLQVLAGNTAAPVFLWCLPDPQTCCSLMLRRCLVMFQYHRCSRA